jgi:hypothetical protein
MHQTTVRFGPDLWEALEAECSRLGVSAAQYVRESALARMAFTAGRAGQPEYEAALAVATADRQPSPSLGLAPAAPAPFGPGDSLRARATATVEHSVEQESSANALGAESSLILRRAREIRAKSRELRAVARQESR